MRGVSFRGIKGIVIAFSLILIHMGREGVCLRLAVTHGKANERWLSLP